MSYVSMNDLLASLGWPDGWIDGVNGHVDGGTGLVIEGFGGYTI